MTKEPCTHVHSLCHSPPHPGPVSPAGAKSRNGWVCVMELPCEDGAQLSSAQLPGEAGMVSTRAPGSPSPRLYGQVSHESLPVTGHAMCCLPSGAPQLQLALRPPVFSQGAAKGQDSLCWETPSPRHHGPRRKVQSCLLAGPGRLSKTRPAGQEGPGAMLGRAQSPRSRKAQVNPKWSGCFRTAEASSSLHHSQGG